MPGVPFTSASRADSACRENRSAPSATGRAPRITRKAPRSARSTTSGSRTPRSASKSPPRAAARKASTTSRWRVRLTSRTGTVPCTWRRAPAGGVAVPRSESVARWARFHRTARQTCRAGPMRVSSSGPSVSRTTSRAMPTESARSTACSGSIPVAAADDWIGHTQLQRFLLAPRFPRTQHVEAHPGHDCRQPAGEIVDVTGGSNGSIGSHASCTASSASLSDQYVVRNGPQPRAVFLKPFRQPVLLNHTVTPFSPARGTRRRCSKPLVSKLTSRGTGCRLRSRLRRWPDERLQPSNETVQAERASARRQRAR